MSRPRRTHRDDRGVTMILYALLMLTILLITALVIDLSFVRNTRQDSKSIADATTAAAMQSMATTDAEFYPWAGACAGLAYLRANDPGAAYSIQYFDGTGITPVAGTPCTSLLDAQCSPNTPTSWAWIRATSGDKVVDIRAGYLLPDPQFPDESSGYSGDVGSSTLGSCDQLATIVSDVDDVFFGGVAGASPYGTAIRTVGRALVSSTAKIPPAFLMLERKNCGVLVQRVGSGQGIAVEPASPTEPGRVHLDSSGKGTCPGSAENAYTVYSDALGSSPKFAGIRILGSSTNPGQLSLRSLDPILGSPANATAKSDGICTTYIAASTTCLYNAPLIGGVIGREPVDTKYNPAVATGLTFLESLHSTTVADARRTTPPAVVPPAVAWRQVTTCDNHSTDAFDAAATRVFVNCPGGYKPNIAQFTAATEIVINGPVELKNGKQLLLPNAKRIVIGGDASGGITTAGGSVLTINTSVVPTDTNYETACDATDAATTNVTPSPRPTASLTIFGGLETGQFGALEVNGHAAFCQTSVYLAGPKSTPTGTATGYSRLSSTDATYDPSCATSPCPLDTALRYAGLRISGKVRWSAPNRASAQPAPGSVGDEDLALWMESGGGLHVAGVLDGTGVFFIPNGPAQMQSPSTFAPRDAQFIARSLQLLQGALLMKPTAGNSVLVDSLGSIGFVR